MQEYTPEYLSSLSTEDFLEKEKEVYYSSKTVEDLKLRNLSKDDLIVLKNTTSKDNNMYSIIEFELLLKSKIEFCEQKYKKDRSLLDKISLIEGLVLLASIIFGYFVVSNVDFPLLSIDMLVILSSLVSICLVSVFIAQFYVRKYFKEEIAQVDLKHRDDLFEINKKFMNKSMVETVNTLS